MRSFVSPTALFVLAASCGGATSERDQWTVFLATDLPVPQLADRALVEILDDSGALACTECRRQLGLPVDVAAWPISFGVVATKKTLHVRARLYRAARAGALGLPPEASALDRVAVLPPAVGNTVVTMALHAECTGVPAALGEKTSCAGAARTIGPETTLPVGRPDPALSPGTWPRARAAPCPTVVPPEMVCVPGGLFVLGDARLLPTNDDFATAPERFVHLSTFAIDRDEVSLGTVRRLFVAGTIARSPGLRSSDPTDSFAFCNYLGPNDPTNDDEPAACLSPETATAVCEKLGKRLPTEAEWEYVAGNRDEKTTYPWGNTNDACDRADVALGVFTQPGIFALGADLCRVRPGQPTRAPGLPHVRNPRDVTTLGVRAMGGGLSEIVADGLAAYGSPCWHPEQPFLDNPRCDPSTTSNRVIRGGAWANRIDTAAAANRLGATLGRNLVTAGVRCAKSLETP